MAKRRSTRPWAIQSKRDARNLLMHTGFSPSEAHRNRRIFRARIQQLQALLDVADTGSEMQEPLC
jgi:hypothetical protein